eukprot:TRINITY_DN5126_c0_g2_i1.p1 TRINITY_DN5126_c0_g2~~TRINITY_DN5126_c0_g2_i1.p1  ORF type:complete len:526 (+),score=71.75 TRINITY_DN5126_c0_g2_i1:321-1898(+)
MGKQLRFHFERAYDGVMKVLRSWGSNESLIDQVQEVMLQLRTVIVAPDTASAKQRAPIEVVTPIVEDLIARVMDVEIPKRMIVRLDSELMSSRELLLNCEKELYQRTTCAICTSARFEKFRAHLNSSRMQYLKELTLLRSQLNLNTEDVYAPVIYTPQHFNEAVVVEPKEKVSRLKLQLIKERVDVGRLFMNMGRSKKRLYKSLKEFREKFGIGTKLLQRAKIRLASIKDSYKKVRRDLNQLFEFVSFESILKTLQDLDDSTSVFCSSQVAVFRRLLQIVNLQPKTLIPQKAYKHYNRAMDDSELSLVTSYGDKGPADRVLIYRSAMQDTLSLTSTLVKELQSKVSANLVTNYGVQVNIGPSIVEEVKTSSKACQVGGSQTFIEKALTSSPERAKLLEQLTAFNWSIASELFMYSKLCAKIRLYGDEGGVAVVRRAWGHRICILSKRRQHLVTAYNRVNNGILQRLLVKSEPKTPLTPTMPETPLSVTGFRKSSASGFGRTMSFSIASPSLPQFSRIGSFSMSKK